MKPKKPTRKQLFVSDKCQCWSYTIVKMRAKQYLGDSVYVDYDGYYLILTTENGIKESNRILLEPKVFEALKNYVDRLKEPQPQDPL